MKANMPAKTIKNTMIKTIDMGAKTTGCQCLQTYFHASPAEKKSFPFNCFNVTRVTAVHAK